MIIPGYETIETKRNEYGLWTFTAPEDFYGTCAACNKTNYNSPSTFCPNCGALMLNAISARDYYERVLQDETVKLREQQEGKNNG